MSEPELSAQTLIAKPNMVRTGGQAYLHLARHSRGSDRPHRQPPARLRLEYTGSLGMPAANSAGRWASCRHAETTPFINGFVPACKTTRARLPRGLSSQLMRTETYHRPRPELYRFALAMPPARSLIDGGQLPTEHTQVSKPLTSTVTHPPT